MPRLPTTATCTVHVRWRRLTRQRPRTCFPAFGAANAAARLALGRRPVTGAPARRFPGDAVGAWSASPSRCTWRACAPGPQNCRFRISIKHARGKGPRVRRRAAGRARLSRWAWPRDIGSIMLTPIRNVSLPSPAEVTPIYTVLTIMQRSIGRVRNDVTAVLVQGSWGDQSAT